MSLEGRRESDLGGNQTTQCELAKLSAAQVGPGALAEGEGESMWVMGGQEGAAPARGSKKNLLGQGPALGFAGAATAFSPQFNPHATSSEERRGQAVTPTRCQETARPTPVARTRTLSGSTRTSALA